jgi:thiamine monophosphate synthase
MGAVVGFGRLHVITDTRSDRHLLAVVMAALDAGAPVIQLRAKGLRDRELYELASRVVAECASRGAWCIVNDRVDIAAPALSRRVLPFANTMRAKRGLLEDGGAELGE